jgi:hypothetical protein
MGNTRDRCYDFLNISAENFSENIVVFCLNYTKFLHKFDHNIVFFEKRQFFAENWQKSQKIVIITSTPGASPTTWIYSNNASVVVG